MRNVLRVFRRDVMRLVKTPAAWSVVLFLIVLPSLYTWFNVAAFWNPYDNTGNLRVCVVNEDAGVDDELLGHLDVGEQVVDQLRENNQLDWQFVDRDEAMSEVDSGQAYAAFVIPEDFSADIATLTTGEFIQPTLEYYVNEKTGPVSPKITDTGANSLDTTINEAFFSTVSSTVAKLLNEEIDATRLQVESTKAQASARIDKALEDIAGTRASLATLSESIDSARAKAQTAQGTLSDAEAGIAQAQQHIGQIGDLLGKANAGLASFSSDITTALDASSGELADVAADTSLAVAQTATAIEAARNALGIPSADEALANADYTELISLLQNLEKTATDEQKKQIEAAIAALKDTPAASSEWRELAAQLDAAAQAANQSSDPVNSLVNQALDAASQYRTTVAASAIPAISSSIATISSASGSVQAALASMSTVVSQSSTVLGQLDSTLALSANALAQTDASLASLAGDLATVKTDLSALASANALSEIVGENGVDPEKVADFMMSPTKIQREELYPINAYGSAMAPLFINLTLWIGVFMLMVIIRLEVDDEGIENLTVAQRTHGRGMLLAILAALQAVVCCTGCLMLGVQTASAPLFYLTAIMASLAYLGVQYTLSTTLQHVGKALCVILVFVQIPGATGLYPIEMTPAFFQYAYPLFPFTYGINAIRETICGFYNGAWASNMGVLLAFLIAFVAIGTIARPYMTNLNRLFAREIEESDIIIGESVQLPARRYPISQMIRAFSDHDEYRDAIEARVARFMLLYPQLKRGALVVGIVAPIVVTAILAALGVEKVVVLTTWLAWFALVVAYLVVVEYLFDYLSHLVSLESMSYEEMRAAYAQREQFTRVQPIIRGLGKDKANDAEGSSHAGTGKVVGWRSGTARANADAPAADSPEEGADDE
ncbi:MAG: YhgE/Pip domain-containing protein [Eggerthellaceae bacterium]|nr:YhgE/Pip domain-containing protein [Eggerthellaceae bacterium]